MVTAGAGDGGGDDNVDDTAAGQSSGTCWPYQNYLWVTSVYLWFF